MNVLINYTTNYTDHGTLTGMGHPHRTLQHDHSEVVGGKDCEGWMGEWISWLIGIPFDKNPINNKPENPFNKGYESTKIFDNEKNEGVFFMAAPTYGAVGDSYARYYEVIPVGNFHLFIVPFMLFNSTLEYPSLDKKTLYAKSMMQVDCMTEISASLDGLGLQCCRVDIDPEKSYKVENIPEKNILGVSSEELRVTNHAEIVGNGFALFLAPLEPGLHRLKYEAYNPNYSLKAEIQLNVRGPRSN